MKLLVISDIHGRIDNLKETLDNSFYDYILVAGDLFGYFPLSDDTLKIFENFNTKYVLGNHDLYFFRKLFPKLFEIKFNSLNLNMLPNEDYFSKYGVLFDDFEVDMQILTNLLENAILINEFHIDNLRIIMCHGSPYNPVDDYIYSDSDKLDKIFDDFEFDILILGHTHKSFIRKKEKRLIVNPGSITLPRGFSNPSLIEIDTDTKTVILKTVEQKIRFKKISSSKVIAY